MAVDHTPVPAGQATPWREAPRRPSPWCDALDDPANLDYSAAYSPRSEFRGYRRAESQAPRPGYRGPTPGPPWGEQPRPPAPGRHAISRGAPFRPAADVPPPAAAAAPGLTQRMRNAARNHTGAAALTAAAVVGTGVGVGMFGFAPFAPPTATTAGGTAAMPGAAPPMVAVTGSAMPVQHHVGYVGKHRKPASAAHRTHHLIGSGAVGGAATAAASPAPQSTGSGGSSPASSAPAPATQPSASSTPRASQGGGGSGSQSGNGSGGGSGSGHRSGGHGGSGGVLGDVTGLLGGLGL